MLHVTNGTCHEGRAISDSLVQPRTDFDLTKSAKLEAASAEIGKLLSERPPSLVERPWESSAAPFAVAFEPTEAGRPFHFND